jgi:hypothetical protein
LIALKEKTELRKSLVDHQRTLVSAVVEVTDMVIVMEVIVMEVIVMVVTVTVIVVAMVVVVA